MNSRRGTVLVVVVVAALGLAACGSSNKSSNANGSNAPSGKTRPHVTIKARNFAFTMPAQIPAGWVDVTLQNTGDQTHQIAFTKLNSVSFATFKAAVTAAAPDLTKLADTVFVGGPNGVDAGGSVTATVHLEPGTYAVACYIPDQADGKPHAAKGMTAQVEVATTAESVETAPTPDAGKLSLSEFTFLVDPSFTGKGMVEIDNVGVQVHEAIIVKENAGKTLADVKKFFLTPPGTPPPPGPPPFTSAGGVVGLGPHQVDYELMALTPGKYVLLCFFPDPTKKNLPHAIEGMLKEITVS